MHIDELQVLRRKLDRRANLVRKSNLVRLAVALRDFFLFLDNEPSLVEILNQLLRDVPDFQEIYVGYRSSADAAKASNEKELAAMGYASLRELSTSKNHPRNIVGALYSIHIDDTENNPQEKRDERMVSFYIDSLLEPFYIFVDEQLDSRRAILSILRKYKHRCEWFERNRLLDAYEKDTQRGEQNLALDFYQFLFNEGVNFSIEPSSLDGKIDLIAAQDTDDPLLADAKVFSGSNKKHLCDGFGQIYGYANKYNEPSGYLLIFNVSDKDLVITGSHTSSPVPSVTHNHRTIYFLIIDICKHPRPPSKRGLVRPVEIPVSTLFDTAGYSI